MVAPFNFAFGLFVLRVLDSKDDPWVFFLSSFFQGVVDVVIDVIDYVIDVVVDVVIDVV